MKCKCKDWKENIPLLKDALIMSHIHDGVGLKKSFDYCPYCGHNLEEEK